MGGVYSSPAEESFQVTQEDTPEVIISHTSSMASSPPPISSPSSPRHKRKKESNPWGGRNSFETRIPFKLLCDSGTQTDESGTVSCECVDSSVQTDTIETEESHLSFTSLYLTPSPDIPADLPKCYCDRSAQTEFIGVSSQICLDSIKDSVSNRCFDSSIQTDDVLVIELRNLIDTSMQTEASTYKELFEANAEMISGQVWNDYIKAEKVKMVRYQTGSSIENEFEEDVEKTVEDELQLQFDNLEQKAALDDATCNEYTEASVDDISEQIWNKYTHNSHESLNGNSTEDGQEDRGHHDNEVYLSSVSESEADETQYIVNNQPKSEEQEMKDSVMYGKQQTQVDRKQELEWQLKFQEQEKKIKEEIAMRELMEVDHREKLDALRHENKNMKQVVAQYENVILELTEQTRDRQHTDVTLSETIHDKEQVQQDLNKAEQSLVDAYKRVEKLKLALDAYKQNEESLKHSINDFQAKLYKSEDRYKKLRLQATEKIDAANNEITKVRKQKEIDLAGIQAALKKSQNRNNNLEKEILQKVRENKELSQICDDLIKKVSGE